MGTINSNSTQLMRPQFMDKIKSKLGGEWDVEAKVLPITVNNQTSPVWTDQQVSSEEHFIPTLKSYTNRIDAENNAAYSPKDQELATKATEAQKAFVQASDGDACDLLKAGLDFARDGLMSGSPAIKSKLQPRGLKDLGDGMYVMSMGFQFPLGDKDATVAVMDKGQLFIDVTPGEQNMTAAWAKRS